MFRSLQRVSSGPQPQPKAPGKVKFGDPGEANPDRRLSRKPSRVAEAGADAEAGVEDGAGAKGGAEGGNEAGTKSEAGPSRVLEALSLEPPSVLSAPSRLRALLVDDPPAPPSPAPGRVSRITLALGAGLVADKPSRLVELLLAAPPLPPSRIAQVFADHRPKYSSLFQVDPNQLPAFTCRPLGLVNAVR